MISEDQDVRFFYHFLFKSSKQKDLKSFLEPGSSDKDCFNNYLTVKKRMNRLCLRSFIHDLDGTYNFNDISTILSLKSIMNTYVSLFNVALHKRKYLDYSNSFLDEEFLLTNIERFISNESIILENIGKFLKEGWKVSMIDKLTLSIIKAALTELMFDKETKGIIIISEYTSMAGGLLVEKKMKFVNGIIDNIYNTLCRKR